MASEPDSLRQDYDKLRRRFPPSQISHRPYIWCWDCEDSPTGACDLHERGYCPSCQMHLPADGHRCVPYVDHNQVVHRLLTVDPGWKWRGVKPENQPFPPGDYGVWIEIKIKGFPWTMGYGEQLPSSEMTEGQRITGMIHTAIKHAARLRGVALYMRTGDTDPDEHSGPTSDTAASSDDTSAAAEDIAHRASQATTIRQLNTLMKDARTGGLQAVRLASGVRLSHALTQRADELGGKITERIGTAGAPPGTFRCRCPAGTLLRGSGHAPDCPQAPDMHERTPDGAGRPDG